MSVVNIILIVVVVTMLENDWVSSGANNQVD